MKKDMKYFHENDKLKKIYKKNEDEILLPNIQKNKK